MWFHGGGFTSGSGGWDWYDGRNLGHTRRFLEILGLAARADLGAALRAVPAEQFLPAYRQLAQEVSGPGSAAPPLYPVLGASGVPEEWPQALAAGRLGGMPLLAGTTSEEMRAFFAFDPRIPALAAGPGRSVDDFTQTQTEILFRDGTLAGRHVLAGGGRVRRHRPSRRRPLAPLPDGQPGDRPVLRLARDQGRRQGIRTVLPGSCPDTASSWTAARSVSGRCAATSTGRSPASTRATSSAS